MTDFNRPNAEPAEPFAPVEPVELAAPAGLAELAAPVEPVEPVEPATSTEPIVSASVEDFSEGVPQAPLPYAQSLPYTQPQPQAQSLPYAQPQRYAQPAQPVQQPPAQPAQPAQPPVPIVPQQPVPVAPQPQPSQQQYAQPPQPTAQQPYPPQHYQTPYAAAPRASGYQQHAPGYHQHTAPASQVPKQKPRGSSKGLALVMGLIGGLIGAAVACGAFFLLVQGFFPTAANEQPSAAGYTGASVTIDPPDEDASLAVTVAKKVLPSVVNIDVYATSSGSYWDFGPERGDNSGDALEEYGLGSGVVISADGYILTNYHVVEGGSEYLVRFDQDNQYKATVVGEDSSSDLAVLKVEATGLVPIEIADSTEVAVGEWVMAVGSPFGLEKSVSTGIVSALFRSTTMESTTGINFYANMIQTDAAINPGNSGGALVNAEGKLIGINTLISSNSGASAGVGFAIPSNYAMSVARQIMDGKEVEHAFLGVRMQTVDAGNASSFNSDVKTGAYIDEVVSGSPADKAGLQTGDIITKMDGVAISSAAELVINVRAHLVGDTVTLEIERDGATKTVDVTLGSDQSS
jgi:putative serine protease PepD